MNLEVKAQIESEGEPELSLYQEMKVILDEANESLSEAQEIEEANDYSDAMESMERKYWEGYTEAVDRIMTLVAARENLEIEEVL